MIDSTPAGYTNYETSLAVDTRGVPHVAYNMWDANELRYAVRTPSGWNFEVAHANHSGGHLSLKLDKVSRPHIAFNNGAPENRSLDYATKSGSAWRTETVDADRPDWQCGLHPRLALDSADRPRIAYTCVREGAASGERLMYAAWDGTRWDIEQIETNDLDPAFGSLAPALGVGPDDRPHISYFNATSLELRHAFHDGVRWDSETVDAGVNLSAGGSSIAVDSSNQVHLAYYNNDRGLLKYARRTDGRWVVDVVDPDLIPGCAGSPSVSLALNLSGRAAIAYEVCKPGVINLGYAWNSTSWSTELVYTEWGSGASPSLAFDRWGNPHISFLHHMAGRVVYAGVLTASPDYVPENLGPPSPATVSPSQPVTLSVNVANLGASTNFSSTLAFYNASTPSAPFALFPVPPLGTLSTSGPYVADWRSPPVPGTYAVVASVDYDSVIPELDEANNLHTWTIEVAPPPLPDLAVLDGDVTATPNTVLVGETVSFSATVRNVGNASADANVAFFRDANANRHPDPGETFDAPPVSLAPGGNETFVRTWVPAAEGTYALCAYADPDGAVAESNEGNNVGCANVVVLAPPETRPDYAPAQIAPTSPMRTGLSMPFALSLAVRSDGNATALADATLALYNESTPVTPFAVFVVSPLDPGETSVRFAAPWMSPARPGTYRVVANVDAGDDLLEWDETNNAYTWIIEVVPGPITALVIGQPNVSWAVPYVTSSTPLSFSVVDQGGTGIRRTMFRFDGGPWVNFTATGPSISTGEGEHTLEWFSEDYAGNVEATQSARLRVDDTSPSTSIAVGVPKHQVVQLYVTSSTPLSLAAADGGAAPVGLALTEYRVDGASWSPYASPFTLAGSDGSRTIEYRSADLLGNRESVRALDIILDNSAPSTSVSPSAPPFSSDALFALSAEDAGSGVRRAEYRVDGGDWTSYAAPFTVPQGHHTIGYRSVDNLGNTETERTLEVTIEAALPVEVNWKPLVALVFTLVLLAVGAWSAWRAPWGRAKAGRGSLKAFAIVALPFAIAEAGTGVVSLLTGLLAIPPLVGWGTAVDVAVLVAGVSVGLLRARNVRRTEPPRARWPHGSRNWNREDI